MCNVVSRIGCLYLALAAPLFICDVVIFIEILFYVLIKAVCGWGALLYILPFGFEDSLGQ